VSGATVSGQSPTPVRLTERGTHVLADFDHKTVDSVFDDRL
jgi:hypothetical protein